MLTWIDQYIKQMGESHKAERMTLYTGETVYNPLAKQFKGMTDYDTVKTYLSEMMDNLPMVYAYTYQQESRAGTNFMMAGLLQGEAVYSMLDPDTRKLALQVEGDLLEDFWGAYAPDTVDYWALLDKYDSVYIDLPPEALNVTERLYIRAIIMHKTPDLQTGNPEDASHWRVFCALPLRETKRHLDNQIEIGWNLGEDVPEDQDKMIRPKNDGYDAKAYEGMSMGEPIRASEFREEVEELIKLILLYYESGEGQRTPLPSVTPEALKRLSNPKKARAKHQQASLFSVVNLRSPAGRFGREDEDREKLTSEGYRLTIQYHRRGHFYWQAHGPGWSERRLRWRKGSTVGPKDAPTKTKMHVLKKETQP